MSLKPGQALGHYRIIEQLGQGGMATVYRASQPSLSRQVAIKVLPEFFAQDPAFHERFKQEATAIAKLRHPNILTVFDSGEVDDVAYIVTELVDGGTLASKLGKKLPIDYCVTMIQPIASALDYAHSRGMIHRDVKPSNILLTADGAPILADFGLARITSTDGATVARLTATGTALGTPEYMAPEQIHNKSVGPAADIYALAVTLYEMLTGTPPYSGDTPISLLAKRLSEPLPRPRDRNPDLPEAVQEVLLKGLANEPADRYGTAGEMIKALEAASRSSAPAPAKPVASTGRKLPLVPILAGVAALLAIGTYVLWPKAGSGATPPSEQVATSELQTAPTQTPNSRRVPTASLAPGPAPNAPASAAPTASKPNAVNDPTIPPHGRLLYSLTSDLTRFAATPQRSPDDTIVVKNGTAELNIGSPMGVNATVPLSRVGDFVAVLRYVATSRQPWLNFRFHTTPQGRGHGVRLPSYLQLLPPVGGTAPAAPHPCCHQFDIFLAPQNPSVNSLFTGTPPLALPAAAGKEQVVAIAATGPEIVVSSGGQEIARASDATFGPGGLSIGVGTGRGQTPAALRLNSLDIYERAASAGPVGAAAPAKAAPSPASSTPPLPPHGRLLYSVADHVVELSQSRQPSAENTLIARGRSLEFTAGGTAGTLANLPLDGLGDFVALLRFTAVSGQPVILFRFHASGPQASYVVKIPGFLHLSPAAATAPPIGVHPCCRDFEIYKAPLRSEPSLFTGPYPRSVDAAANEEQTVVVSVKGPLIIVYAGGQEIGRVSDNTFGPGRIGFQVVTRQRGQTATLRLTALEIYEAGRF